MSRALYAAAMGVLFAALQAGCFFQLQFRMTAAYPSFLAVTVGWLVGSVLGLRVGRSRGGAGQGAWLLASLLSYYLVLLVLQAFAYDVRWLPLVGVLIVVMGMQAGHFFAANRALFPSASRLFLWENNGFVLGWIASFAGQVAFGETFHWTLPPVVGGIAVLLHGSLLPRSTVDPHALVDGRSEYALLLLAGFNLIMLNYTMVRQMSLAFRDMETAVLLMVLAYFAGLSIGYLRPDRISLRFLRAALPVFLVFQLVLVTVAPFVVLHVGALAGDGVAYAVMFLLVTAGSTSLYAIFLPRMIQAEASRARQLYAVEIVGSLLALVCLPILSLGGMTPLFAAYLVSFLGIAVLLGLRPLVLAAMAVVALAYLVGRDHLDKTVATTIYRAYYPEMKVERVLHTRYSPYHKIEVLRSERGDDYLFLNSRRQFGPVSHYDYSYFVAEYPAALLGTPRVCVLGCGSMSTVGRMLPIAKTIDIVDLDTAVFETSRTYFGKYNRLSEFTHWTFTSDDAKHFLASTDRSFDLIVDDIPPAMTRQIALTYTREFFELVRARLNRGGIFSLPSLTATSDESDYGRRMLATLASVFGQVYVVNVGDVSYFFSTDASLQLDRETMLAAIDHPRKERARVFLPREAREIARNAKVITVNNMADLILE